MKTSILISALLATVFSFANSNYTDSNPRKNTEIEKPITAEKTKI